MSNDIVDLEWAPPGGDPVPVGQYAGEFVGVERVPPSADGKMPEALRWKFVILPPSEHAGKTTSCIGPMKPSEKNASGRLLNSMGISFGKPGERVSIKDLIGRKFNLVVGPSKNGKPIVQFAFPLK